MKGARSVRRWRSDPSHDRENLVLYRGRSNFILLNLYPYTTGHVLVTPYAHVANLDQVTPETLVEMMELAQRLQTHCKNAIIPKDITLA